ncbi:MAG: oxidoreductase [Thermonemataceae bacterium]
MQKKQVILVTGASSGIGKATAKQLLEEGHTVYTAARRVEKMDDLKALGATPLKMDITKEEEIQQVVATIEKEHGGVDVLVNNAGYAIYGAMEDTKIEDARRQFEVNLFGLARLTQLVHPYMRSQKAGKIINLSSMGGKMYTPLGAWYHATKHALEGWSDCLRLELKQFNIEVVIIEPGVIETEFGDVMLQPLLDRSGEGPYSQMANALANATKKSYEQGDSSPATVIAKLITKAVRAQKPKTRYVAGKYAKPMMFIRKYLGDSIFDKIIMSQVKS